MLTYVDWTPGRWGRVQTELLCPCGLPVLYLTARDVPARRVLRTLRRLRRAGDVRCAILPDALTPRAALCGIADPDETALRRALLTPLMRALTGAEDGARIPAVLLSAPAASPAVYAAAEELAHAARRLLLDVGAGQEDLSDYLRRRFGLRAGRPRMRRSASASARAARPRSFSAPAAARGSRWNTHSRRRMRPRSARSRRTAACSVHFFRRESSRLRPLA